MSFPCGSAGKELSAMQGRVSPLGLKIHWGPDRLCTPHSCLRIPWTECMKVKTQDTTELLSLHTLLIIYKCSAVILSYENQVVALTLGETGERGGR